jgi:hypothetical protein
MNQDQQRSKTEGENDDESTIRGRKQAGKACILLRSKRAIGWESVSAGRSIGAWGSKTAFRHASSDQEICTKLMTLCKCRHADTFPPAVGVEHI